MSACYNDQVSDCNSWNDDYEIADSEVQMSSGWRHQVGVIFTRRLGSDGCNIICTINNPEFSINIHGADVCSIICFTSAFQDHFRFLGPQNLNFNILYHQLLNHVISLQPIRLYACRCRHDSDVYSNIAVMKESTNSLNPRSKLLNPRQENVNSETCNVLYVWIQYLNSNVEQHIQKCRRQMMKQTSAPCLHDCKNWKQNFDVEDSAYRRRDSEVLMRCKWCCSHL